MKMNLRLFFLDKAHLLCLHHPESVKGLFDDTVSSIFEECQRQCDDVAGVTDSLSWVREQLSAVIGSTSQQFDLEYPFINGVDVSPVYQAC